MLGGDNLILTEFSSSYTKTIPLNLRLLKLVSLITSSVLFLASGQELIRGGRLMMDGSSSVNSSTAMRVIFKVSYLIPASINLKMHVLEELLALRWISNG